MIEGSGSIPLTNRSGWIQIQEVQKHVDPVDPVDPYSDPDPQHWYFLTWLKCSLTNLDPRIRNRRGNEPGPKPTLRNYWRKVENITKYERSCFKFHHG